MILPRPKTRHLIWRLITEAIRQTWTHIAGRPVLAAIVAVGAMLVVWGVWMWRGLG